MPATSARDAALQAYRERIASPEDRGRVIARTDLSFTDYITRVLPSYPFHYPHLQRLIVRLEQMASREPVEDLEGRTLDRLIVIMPPRHWKTTTISRLFLPYWLLRFPDQWAGLWSYNSTHARLISRHARRFYTDYGGELGRSSSKAVELWETGAGGGMWATGIRGGATGKGANIGVIDDPIKNMEEAESETIRKRNELEYEASWDSRREGDGLEIIVLTRWPPRDMVTYLAERTKHRYHVMHFDLLHQDPEEERRKAAAENRTTGADFPEHWTLEDDWREPDEVLCPEIRTKAAAITLRESVLIYVWTSLYQGRPRPAEGSVLKRAWFQYLDARPAKGGTYCRFWDYGALEDGDYTAGVLMQRTPDGRYVILDVRRERLMAAECDAFVMATDKSDAAEFEWEDIRFVREQEPGASGRREGDLFVLDHAGLASDFRPATGSEMARVRPLASQAKAKNVYLLRNPEWNGVFLDEVCAYPHGDYDDQLKAAAGSFMELALPEGPEAVDVVYTP